MTARKNVSKIGLTAALVITGSGIGAPLATAAPDAPAAEAPAATPDSPNTGTDTREVKTPEDTDAATGSLEGLTEGAGQAGAQEGVGEDNDSAATADSDDAAEAAAQVLKAQNEWRAKNGASELKENKQLAEGAQKWADELAKSGKFEHDPALKENNFSTSENLYTTTSPELDPNAPIDAWDKSEGHHKNMVDAEVNSTGIGIAKGENGEWIVVARYADEAKLEG